ncbi:MAG: hypothetical protein K2N23_00240 [Clostridia bacterium]|nr:hypothetical protein [Clostridia bacterium]
MDYYEQLNFDRVKGELSSIESHSDSLLPALNAAVSNLKADVAGQLNRIKWDDEIGQAIKDEIINKIDTYARKWESDHRQSMEDVVKRIKAAVNSLKDIIRTYES